MISLSKPTWLLVVLLAVLAPFSPAPIAAPAASSAAALACRYLPHQHFFYHLSVSNNDLVAGPNRDLRFLAEAGIGYPTIPYPHWSRSAFSETFDISDVTPAGQATARVTTDQATIRDSIQGTIPVSPRNQEFAALLRPDCGRVDLPVANGSTGAVEDLFNMLRLPTRMVGTRLRWVWTLPATAFGATGLTPATITSTLQRRGAQVLNTATGGDVYTDTIAQNPVHPAGIPVSATLVVTATGVFSPTLGRYTLLHWAAHQETVTLPSVPMTGTWSNDQSITLTAPLP